MKKLKPKDNSEIITIISLGSKITGKKTFVNYVIDKLKFKAYTQYINASFYKFSEPEDIESILSNNLSIEDLKSISKAEKEFEQDYSLLEENDKPNIIDSYIKIVEELTKSNDPIIVYYPNFKELNYIIETSNKLNSEEKTKLLKNIDFDTFFYRIERNIEQIYQINPSAQIFILGNYMDNSLSTVRKNINNSDSIHIISILRKLISIYNRKLNFICSKYNAIFIEDKNICSKYIPFNNFTRTDNKIIAKKIVDSYNKESDIYVDTNELFCFTDKGIYGMYDDLEKMVPLTEAEEKEIDVKKKILRGI